MKNLFSSIMLIISIISANAQSTTNEVLADYRKIVFFSGGDTTIAFLPSHVGKENADGMDLSAPWEYQKEIWAVPLESVPEITTKVKNKHFDKFKAKDYDGYVLGDKIYYGLNVKSVVSVGDNWVFVKLISDGKISLYKYFEDPEIASVTNDGLSDKFIWAAENPDWVFYKKNSKKTARYIEDLAAKRDLSDCTEVYTKFKNKDYRSGDSADKKLISDQEREEANLLAIHDYNEKCK